MIPVSLGLLLACGRPEPAPLPAPVLPPAELQARMVAMGEVRGWLARPLPHPGDSREGVLVLVDRVDETVRTRAAGDAAAGAVVLAITADVDAAAATDYLEGMPDVRSVDVRCERADCAPSPSLDRTRPAAAPADPASR